MQEGEAVIKRTTTTVTAPEEKWTDWAITEAIQSSLTHQHNTGLLIHGDNHIRLAVHSVTELQCTGSMEGFNGFILS